MAWLGIDDTDSPRGGCTTWVLSEVLHEVQRAEAGIDLIGHPRLVRLNPNIPWKTRGNAALGARFGTGRGRPTVVGEVRGLPLRSYPSGGSLDARREEALWKLAMSVLLRSSDRSEPGTDPTLVLSPRRLPAELYWRAVREVVPWRAVQERLLSVPGLQLAAFGSGQGLVGAAAALAWPGLASTWEAIAYREAARWGSPRRVEVESVRRMTERYPETFLSFDEETRRTLVAPHTPCPILLGLRATDPRRLPAALSEVVTPGEVRERWVLFRTNQATGDHLVPRALGDRAPASSGLYEGTVVGTPEVLEGGHVRFRIEAEETELACLAFEPTKVLPKVARALLSGDQVRVWGSSPYEAPSEGAALRLEGLQVLSARPRWVKVRNPRCPGCGTRMGSTGRGKGFRCSSCGARTPLEAAPGRWDRRGALCGTYLPTPSSRRHLAPLGPPARAHRVVYSPG